MRTRLRSRYIVLLAAVLLLALGAASIAGAVKPETVDVQILAINDFHGNLEPPAGSSGRIGTINAGGVEYLATHINTLRATNPNTVVVSAGDMIGASPLLSALFHDEPTIEAFNLIGLDYNAVGNHEFDEGCAELLRMQDGGCHPVDGCLDGDDFEGADFTYLAANVVRQDNGKTIFPAYKMRSFAGAKVAFIGMTLEGTPIIVTPSGVAGLNFLDEADTVNALVPELKAQGHRDDRRPDPRRRRAGSPAAVSTAVSASPARSSTSSTAWTTKWTWSSAATPTTPTTASSTASSSPAPPRSVAWSPRST